MTSVLDQVSFIGISNWALDPAKMNRGILLSRAVPDKTDLIKIAEGICAQNQEVFKLMKPVIDKLASGYEAVYSKQDREYFGLRDFYSLVKMVHSYIEQEMLEPDWTQVTYAVQRNFGGFFGSFKPTEVFLKTIYPNIKESSLVPTKTLLTDVLTLKGDSRYVLLLTKNNAALNIIQDQVQF